MAGSPMTTLLSVDPGGSGAGTSGVVLLSYTDTTAPVLEASWAVPDALEGWLGWYDTHSDFNPEVVVCEHFVNRNVPGADLTPCFIEGSVCTLYRYTLLQPAAGKNSAVPNRVLERLGLFSFPRDHHHDQREAARHAVWHLKKTEHRPTLRVGWGHTEKLVNLAPV